MSDLACMTMAKQMALQDVYDQTKPDEHYLPEFTRAKVSSKLKQFSRFFKNISTTTILFTAVLYRQFINFREKFKESL